MKRYKYLMIEDDGFKRALFDLSEGTINPDKYLYDIEEKIDNVLKRMKNKNYKLTALCMILSSAVSKYKIDFKGESNIVSGQEDFIKFGINKGATKPDEFASIRIYCNPFLLKIQQNEIFLNSFKKELLVVLKHELIHRGQDLQVKDLKLRFEVMSSSHESLIKDLADKKEIMARAWEIIELFKLKNDFTKEEIRIRIIKHDDYRGLNNTLDFYFKAFGKNSSVIKLLYKYMYLYLEEN